MSQQALDKAVITAALGDSNQAYFVGEFAGDFAAALVSAGVDPGVVEKALQGPIESFQKAREHPSPVAYRDAARDKYQDEGRVEVDDCADLSRADEDASGSYVAAWVWVDDEEVEHA